MKKFYVLILLFFFNSIVSAQTSTAPAGTGTQCNPYQIASLENLYWITQNSSVWTGARFFIQTQNIDATSTNTWASGAGWIPIGSSASRFDGHYNGQGFKITNLFMNRPSGDKAFFAWLQGATVKNLTIESPSFTLTSSGNWNAIFAARAGNVTIDNVKIVGGSLTASGSGISAPMFGEVYTLSGSTSTISNCSNTANATLKDYTAGFLGTSNTYGNAITISNCFSNATIIGTWRVGGFAGHPSGTITFERCYASGSVSGSDNVGGFIGVCADAVQTFNDCYSTANVSATTWKGGGFFGWIWNWNSVMNINFNRCYATGSVSGGNPKGGFGGDDNGYTSNVFFSNCFWDNQTTGITTGVGTNSRTGLTGLSTANMKTQTSFSNATWNFTTTWAIAGGVNNGYPSLRFPTITNLTHPTCSPTITTSGTLTSFTTCQGTASANQTLTVSGSNLTANISISAPSGFEISTNASNGFASSLTLTQSGGSVASTTIFIRMTAAATGSPNGNISLTSTGATTVDRAVSGTAASLSVGTASSSQVICHNINASNITLSGSSGTIQWQRSADNTTWTNISSATSATLTATQIGAITSTTFIRAQVTSGSCSGNSNTVTLEVNNALAFDGTGDFVSLGTNSIMNLTSNLTIEAWVYVPVSPKFSINTIYSKKNPGVWSGYMFGFNNYETTDLKVTFECGNTSAISSNKTLNSGSWNHAAIVISNNGTIGTFYINGSHAGSFNVLLTNASSFSEFIGSMHSSGMYSLQGILDELRIWNTARTQQEILDNMDNPLTGSETGLVAYYDFDQGIPEGVNTGITSVLNKTSNSLNGTFLGISRTGTTSNFVHGNHATIVSSDYGCVNGNSARMVVGATGRVPSSIQWYRNTSNSTSGATLLTGSTSQVFNTDASESNTKFYYATIAGTCAASTNSNIISLQNPVVTGTFDIYEDNTTQLSCTDAAAASTPWVSLNTSLLTTSNTGLITGVYPGSGRVVYTTNAGCKDTVTVNIHETEWNGNNSNDFTLGSNWKLNTRPAIIRKIRFNNSAANNLILNSRITIDSIDFGTSNRQIELGDNDLIVNHIRNFNANRFIKTNGVGKVKKQLIHNTSFTFPVGKSSYNPITITNKTGTADSFSVNIIDTAYFNGTTSGNINNPYVKRTWNISKNTPSANSGSGVDISFTWNANEVVGTLTTPTLNHHNGIGWEIPTMGTTSVSGNTLTYTGYKGMFSPFAIGGSSTVALPVELKEFKTSCQNDYIQIDWTTASEIRNKAFELYKSENAQDWNFIHTEAGQGDKATETQYSFKDLDKKIGYYRLKDIDEDGIENWSQIIFSDCKNDVSGIQIYPNPASDFIKVVAPISENTILKILSLEGKVLKTISLISNQTLVPVNDLASGVYIIDLNNVMQKIKFIKD
jgi:hypothetical protein